MRQPLIPLRYRTESSRDLRQDLERMAQSLVVAFQQAPNETDMLPALAPLGSVTPGFGQILRLEPEEDEWITIQLGPPSAENACRSFGIARLSTAGAIELSCIGGCTVNGYTSLLLLGEIRMNTVTTDGENYFLDNQGALNWSYGL